MSFRQSRRRSGGNPARLRQLRGEPAVSAVDQAASPIEQAFAALIVATMLVTSAYLVLM